MESYDFCEELVVLEDRVCVAMGLPTDTEDKHKKNGGMADLKNVLFRGPSREEEKPAPPTVKRKNGSKREAGPVIGDHAPGPVHSYNPPAAVDLTHGTSPAKDIGHHDGPYDAAPFVPPSSPTPGRDDQKQAPSQMFVPYSRGPVRTDVP